MSHTPKTIFCDIDGTLVEHHGDIFKNAADPMKVLPNVLQTIKSWDKHNYKIILTTGRKESTRAQTVEQLKQAGIVYDTLIMGLPNGDRILLNDKKQDSPRNTAYAINLVRNQGFENLDLTSKLVTLPERFLFEKVEKPWGYEELVECNDSYVVKKLFMKTGCACSTQYHTNKRETIMILSGSLKISTGSTLESLTSAIYTPFQTITIQPYTVHKMEAVEDCLYMETSTNELWDVVRLKDLYGRC